MDGPKQQLCLFITSSLHIFFMVWTVKAAASSSNTPDQLKRGFAATHDSSYTDFQSLLSDPTGVFSLGFLRVASTQLDLVVIHLPSSLAIWRAIPAKQASWFDSASLTFNGSLVLSSSKEGVLWSTGTLDGSHVVLLNISNLQVQKLSPSEAVEVLWQSFDFPADTLVQGQNFTSSLAVFSANQRFSLRLGADYLALYVELSGGATPMYWKHGALKEANAQVNRSHEAPLLYARVEPNGLLAMYQSEAILADMLPFDSFNRGIREFRRLTLEPDGNLRAYYWNGTVWVKDFAAVTEPCGLPAICGSYGLCSVDAAAPRCRCLQDNSTGTCPTPAGVSGNFCRAGGVEGYAVLRRKGIDLPDKELTRFLKVGSLAECERSCEQNCSCWGAIYSNVSGYCYPLDYLIQTLVEGDQRKFGYFKMKSGGGEGGIDGSSGRRSVKVALSVVGGGIFVGAAVFGICKAWRSRRMRSDSSTADGATPGQYKDLKSASFRSIHIFNSFRKQPNV